MTNTPEKSSLDRTAGLSLAEKEAIKTKSVEIMYKDIKNQGRNLYAEVMNNIHMENRNKVNDASLNHVGLNVARIEDTIKKDGEIFARYQRYNLSHKGTALALSDKGIALAQALAETCVDSLPDGTKVKNMLIHTNYFASTKDIDGYMGPNTTLLLEKIAKSDLGNNSPILSFDGTITPELMLKMYKQCNTEFEPTDVSPKSNENKNVANNQSKEKTVIATPNEKVMTNPTTPSKLETFTNGLTGKTLVSKLVSLMGKNTTSNTLGKIVEEKETKTEQPNTNSTTENLPWNVVKKTTPSEKETKTEQPNTNTATENLPWNVVKKTTPSEKEILTTTDTMTVDQLDIAIKKAHDELGKIIIPTNLDEKDNEPSKILWKNKQNEISNLVEQKKNLMTPLQIQIEIEDISQKISNLKISRTKENEFHVNSEINALQTQLDDFKELLAKKQASTTEEVKTEEIVDTKKAIADSRLNSLEGKDNTLGMMYFLLEDTMGDYLNGKVARKERKELNHTFETKIKDFKDSENPYLATYKYLTDDLGTGGKALQTKLVYALKLMSMIENNRYEPDFTPNDLLSEKELAIVGKSVNANVLKNSIDLIRKDEEFTKNPNYKSVPLTSFTDIINVYSAALINLKNPE